MKNNNKINKDTKLFIEAEKISEKIIDSINNKTKFSDLDNEIKEYKNIEELTERLTSKERHQYIYNEFKKVDKDVNIKKLLKRVDKSQHRFQLRRKRVIYAITSVAALLVVGVFLLINDTSKEYLMVYNNESSSFVEPTLILDNGDNIPLSSTDVNVDKNSYKIEKVASEKLKYSVCEKDSVLKYNKIIVPAGYTYTIILDDGTEVMLNANSDFTFPTEFSEDKREVQLNGEAYFKVTKSSEPFIVKTSQGDIRVYGTEFNVFCGIEGEIETLLVEGSVGMKCKNNDEIKLVPNQLAKYNEKQNEMNITTVDVESHLGWTNGTFIFKGASLKRVLYSISSWYGVKINVNKNIDDIVITMVQNKNQILDNILDFISDIANVKFIKERKGEYTIER